MRTAWRTLVIADPPPGSEDCDEASIAWDGERVSVGLSGQALPVAHILGDAADAALCAQAALLAQVFRRFAAHRVLYAAGFATQRGALALIAPSGAGKTTLMLELARRGRKVFGDEFLLLDRPAFVVRPFPMDFVVRAPTLALVADAKLSAGARTFDGSPAEGGAAGRRLRVDVAEVFGADIWAEPAPLTDVVFLHRAGSAGARLENVPSAAAALEMLPHFFIDSLAMSDVWEVTGKIAPLRCHRLFMSDCAGAADALETLAGRS